MSDVPSHLIDEITQMINGPIATNNFGPDSALYAIRAHMRAEKGYSDALVMSLPAWAERYPLTGVGEQPAIEESVTEEKPAVKAK